MIRPSWGDYGTHEESYYPELWDGCVGAWCPSLGPTGNKLYDLTLGRNNGTLTNMDAATDWSSVGGEGALDFDGANDRVNTGLVGPLGASPRTICAWIYARAIGVILSYGVGAVNARFAFGLASTAVYGNTVGQPWVELNATLYGGGPDVRNTLAHVAVTYTSGTLSSGTMIYVNGKKYAATSGTGTGTPNTSATIPIAIGVEPTTTTSYFNGAMDDIRVYNRTLAAEEIKLLAAQRAVAYIPRRRNIRRAYSMPSAAFMAAWARNANSYLQPGVRLP